MFKFSWVLSGNSDCQTDVMQRPLVRNTFVFLDLRLSFTSVPCLIDVTYGGNDLMD